jgi:hypothetical protein
MDLVLLETIKIVVEKMTNIKLTFLFFFFFFSLSLSLFLSVSALRSNPSTTTTQKKKKKKKFGSPGGVAHTCNSSHLGGGDKED